MLVRVVVEVRVLRRLRTEKLVQIQPLVHCCLLMEEVVQEVILDKHIPHSLRVKWAVLLEAPGMQLVGQQQVQPVQVDLLMLLR